MEELIRQTNDIMP